MGKKTVKDQFEDLLEQLPDKSELAGLKDQVVERLPDKAELAALRDDLAERLPDKAELLAMRDSLVDRLPDDLSDKLPVETKKAKRFATVKKVAFVGLVTAGIAGAVAFVRAKMNDQPAYTPPPAPTYTPPPTDTPPAA